MTTYESLVTLVFGTAALPDDLASISAASSGPISNVQNVSEIKLLESTVDSEHCYGYLYVPSADVKGELVVVHQGHNQDTEADGVGDAARALVEAGFHTLVCCMPGFADNDGSDAHEDYASETNGLRFFVSPIVQFLNRLIADYTFSRIAMTGISGGGWTTTLCAAIDDRIDLSIPVAGSIPQALRMSASVGDWEQSKIYDVCDYPALYALACSGGRRQVQILNRDDDCCFSRSGASTGAYGTNYAAFVAGPVNAVAGVLGGSFEFIEDTSHADHKISQWAITNVILAELGVTPPVVSVIGDTGTGYSSQGGPSCPWTQWTGYPNDYHNGNCQSCPKRVQPTDAKATATFDFTGRSGELEIQAFWAAHANRGTNVPYEIYDGSTLLATVTIDQQQAASGGDTDAGKTFHVLGTWTFSDHPKIVVTNDANGYVIADAVLVKG